MDCFGPFSKPVEAVIGFISKLGVRHVTYIIRYKQNVLELKDSARDLGFEKERIDHQRDEASKNLNNIEGKVIEWVQKVGEIETIVEEFENGDGHKRAQSLSCNILSYLLNRHRLGRQAKKMEVDVRKLIDECPNLDEVSYREDVTSNDATLSNYGFIEFSSTKSTMEKVMTQLEDSTVRMVGLYGQGGVGKSTLVKEIARKVKDNKVFDVVVRVKITANPNLQNVQEEIAYVLGLRLEGEGENVRADCLRRRLKKEKRNVLLILDDLWDKLDLNKLGIPVDDDDDDFGSGNKDLNHQMLEKNNDNKDPSYKVLNKEKVLGSHKGCKILLTSRDKKVLCDKMDIKSTFCVKELDEKDALMLFQKLVGNRDEMSDYKQEIVKKYCAGLPIAIVTVARALRSKSESVWEATLEKLKKQQLVEVQTSMDISVKMSYDNLENEEIKSIFLLCAQMGHQPLIMDLVKYCFGLGILDGVSSIWEARDRIKTSIQKLKDSGLLLDGSSNNHFNMHDMVRDAALSIANKDRNVFTLRNGKLDYWPELKTCTSISISNCDITDGLPDDINCSQLQFFQIDTNDSSLVIPDNFFEGMKNLEVLILTGFRLSRLPPSIQFLLKLRMLCLERCTLDDENLSIGKLKKLRILSFSGSQLKNLPSDLGSLDRLQLLDIDDCSLLNIHIPPNLLSCLTHLEELYIRKSLIKTLAKGETNQGQNSFLSELKNLHQLKVVDLSIPCLSVLPNHLFFDTLKDYKIVVGDLEVFSVGDFRMPDKYETFRVLALQLNDAIDIHSHEGIKMLFKTVQCLLLGKVDRVQSVVNDLNIEGFPDLKHLYIVNNNNIKYVNATKLSNCVDIFPNLESLCLHNLVNLEMICFGLLTVASFAKLKAIKVEMCNRLENLYSFYTVKFPTGSKPCEISECNSFMDKFPTNVEIIEVCECGSLKEILQIPMDYGKIEFLKLHTLSLQSLPSLTCFYTKVDRSCRPHLTEVETTSAGSREIINEEDKQNDKTLPLFGELVEIPNLEILNISSLNIYKIWSNKHSSSFWGQNLIKLVVKDCDKLTYLCSLSMASSLKKLKSLVISECLNMEKIFETEENSADKVCVFPKLEEIHLSKMNRLIDIWETKVSIDSFSNLISVKIEECNKLNKIFPSHMKGWVECLDNLAVRSCRSMEEIFEINDYKEIDEFRGIDTNLQVILLENLPNLKQLWSRDPGGILNFKKLRTIDVYDCNELRNLFPTSVAEDVPKLERISTLCCAKMVEIVASQDTSDANNDPLVFPELTCVRLEWLPNIKHFCKGKHIIKCPKLKELSINNDVKLFLKEINETTNKEEKCAFSAEEVLPNLEYMKIDLDEAQELLPKYQMQRLKELSLTFAQSVDLVYQFPYSMPNLEKLTISCISFLDQLDPRANFAQQEIFGIALQLKELVLDSSNIKDLKLGRVPVLQRLELLSLKYCNNLKNLCPPSVSLTYLTYLELKYCKGLRNLIASSTAQSMVQLNTMKIIYCSEVEQIVSNEGNEKGEVMKIVFSKLISIELVGLNNMRSFCGENKCEFEFPSLEILIVRECLKMKKFSETRSITPKLKNVFGVEGDEKARWQWEGDLNATIQKVFNHKASFPYREHLRLDNNSESIIEQLWQDSGWVQQNSFGYLKRLEVYECHSVVHVIPSHLLSCFHNLEELDVKDCKAAQIIFNIKDENTAMTKASGIFRLKKLSLWNVPKLEHVWDKDPEGVIGLQVLKEMRVVYCMNLRSLFPASVAKDLKRLEVLEVTACEELTEIFKKDEKGGGEIGTTQDFVFPRLTSLRLDQLPCPKHQITSSTNLNLMQGQLCLSLWPFPNSSFGLLDSLTVDGCHFLSDVLLPFNLLPFLNNLEELAVGKCSCVKSIFGVKCTTQDTITFPLKKLNLSNLPKLKNIWNEDPSGVLSMHHLQEVHVEKCEEITNVFPASIAKDLVELKNLNVEDCKGLMTIVAENDADPSGTNQELPCPLVRSLKLKGLPMFKYFYYCSLQSSKFAHLKSHTDNQVYIEKLFKCLSLGKNGVEMILSGKFQGNFLRNLKVLTLLGSESDVFAYKVLKQVPHIENLVVCELKELQLEFLRDSVSIGLENSWIEPFVGNLEILKVIRCGSLQNLVACKVSFSNLTYLKVRNCSSLSYLFTSSTSKSLCQLKKMKLKWCESIEEIVSKEEGEEESEGNEIIFPKLNHLNLYHLEKLRKFYRGSLNFPSLEELSIKNCDMMITLCTGTLKTDRLSGVILDDDSGVLSLETNLNSTMQKKFLKESRWEKSLEFRDRADLQDIWRISLQIPNFYFIKLETLIVDGCHSLSDALPFTLLPLLPRLQTLKVQNCDSVKTIFDVKCTTQDTLVTLPLNELVLSELPNLETVWNEDPHRILSMHNLQKVSVDRCKCLQRLFPASVAKDLEKLESLVVKDCAGLMTIVGEESEDRDKEIIFERLRVLDLTRLEKLRCFCADNLTLRFPSLEEVHVIKCSSMKTFSAFNNIHHSKKWYYESPREESDLNSAVRRTSEEQVDSKLQ